MHTTIFKDYVKGTITISNIKVIPKYKDSITHTNNVKKKSKQELFDEAIDSLCFKNKEETDPFSKFKLVQNFMSIMYGSAILKYSS
jgi:hypothetical protein